MQCRITTEDPPTASGPTPGVSPATAHRAARASGWTAARNLGAEIGAHFDSMLVKLTCRGRDFSTAVTRARRALAEFRIRGVSTNIPFLQAVVDDPDFRAGRVTTSFIDERPQLLTAHTSADRGTKILNYLAEVTVNSAARAATVDGVPAGQAARRSISPASPPPGSKQRLIELGPEGFARWLRDSPAVGVTDTTFRDAHQSLLATRVRTIGSAGGGAVHRADDAAVAVGRVLGRRDLRCGAAVPEGRSVGAAGRAAGGDAQHLSADAAARAATPSATPRIRSRSPRRSSRRRRRPGSTSTGSSTR